MLGVSGLLFQEYNFVSQFRQLPIFISAALRTLLSQAITSSNFLPANQGSDSSRTQVQHHLNKAVQSYLALKDFTKVIRDIREKGFLERLQCFCPPEIVEDDAAVIATQVGRIFSGDD